MSAERSVSCLSPWQVRKVLNHIDANIAEDMPVASLARLFGLSGGYFSRAFHASLGTPPHAFILDRRLTQAMTLIRASGRSLSSIAQDCGFCDQAHLTKCFRRVLGTTPAAWRRGQHAVQLPAQAHLYPPARQDQGPSAWRASAASVRPSIRAA